MTLRKADWTRYLRDPRAMKDCYKIEMIDRTARGLQEDSWADWKKEHYSRVRYFKDDARHAEQHLEIKSYFREDPWIDMGGSG